MKKSLALLLALMLCLSMSLTGMAEPDLAALEGSYILDASALGMPMSVYLLVDAEGGFTWTNKLEGGADKGNGVIGAEGDTYLLLYSDSTPDKLKMAPFVVEGKTLVFKDRIPYGSSGFAPKLENPDQPVYPTARLIAFEEALGTYSGGHTAQAMGSELDYQYDLVLDYGAAYTFTNRFVMGGEAHEFAQQGLFDIQDGVIKLFNPDREGQEGQVQGDGIVLNVFLSPMSKSLAEVSLKKATTAQQAGVYLAVKDMSMMGFSVSAALILDAFGGYAYKAQTGDGAEAAYEEAGSFGMDGNKLTILDAKEGAEPGEGVLTGPVLTVKMPVSPQVPMKTELIFYKEDAVGVFKAEGKDEAGAVYACQLTLNTDGTYALQVMKDGAAAYEENGAFAYLASPMGTALELTSSAGLVSSGMVSGAINITHNIDEAMNTLGFAYSK
jgi:hypothetical protein